MLPWRTCCPIRGPAGFLANMKGAGALTRQTGTSALMQPTFGHVLHGPRLPLQQLGHLARVRKGAHRLDQPGMLLHHQCQCDHAAKAAVHKHLLTALQFPPAHARTVTGGGAGRPATCWHGRPCVWCLCTCVCACALSRNAPRHVCHVRHVHVRTRERKRRAHTQRCPQSLAKHTARRRATCFVHQCLGAPPLPVWYCNTHISASTLDPWHFVSSPEAAAWWCRSLCG